MKFWKINRFVTNCVILISLLLFSFGRPQTKDASIIGTWVSESDANWKMVFTKKSCQWFYQNVEDEEFKYKISNTSPKCGQKVLVNSKTSYLEITNIFDPKDQYCYEIYGLTDKILSIREINSGDIKVFKRQ